MALKCGIVGLPNVGTSVGALKASYHHAVKKVEEYVKSHETRIEP